jgi:hypothetical protein
LLRLKLHSPFQHWSIPISLLCLIAGHRRSKSRAYFAERLGRWRSFCARCRRPMLRGDDGKWRLEEEREEEKARP